jgi:hypothetical protein
LLGQLRKIRLGELNDSSGLNVKIEEFYGCAD